MKDKPGIYLVMTDPVAGYVACAEAAVVAGLRYVQLRMKGANRDEVVRVGHVLRAATRGTATKLIVNDDVTVAREVDADGLHLGQSDMTVTEARRLWPGSESKNFGLSTHNETQAQQAQNESPDYIGVGPVFATPTKRIADPVLGVVRAAAIVRQSAIQTVAIGGIDLAHLPALLTAGIRHFAVVRYVCQRPRPLDAIRELLQVAESTLQR